MSSLHHSSPEPCNSHRCSQYEATPSTSLQCPSQTNSVSCHTAQNLSPAKADVLSHDNKGEIKIIKTKDMVNHCNKLPIMVNGNIE